MKSTIGSLILFLVFVLLFVATAKFSSYSLLVAIRIWAVAIILTGLIGLGVYLITSK